ncbi:MAG TPA: DUF2934 domain-containing protein [Opitutus sp.]|nr:DUF2934 domain-containing protein [Opitutus sp.]
MKTKNSPATAPRRKSDTPDAPGAVSRPVPTHEQIAARAREIWLAHGQTAGDDLANWLAAERELSGTAGFLDSAAYAAGNPATPNVEEKLDALEEPSEARPARSATSL